jgi:hypothetical protein
VTKEAEGLGGPVGGVYTLHLNGQYATYNDLHQLLDTSDPGVVWALGWANHE